MKAAKKSDEKKTPGTVAVENHRPLLNKLSNADRQRLRQRAAELLYGQETLAPLRESSALAAVLLEGVRSSHRPYTPATLAKFAGAPALKIQVSFSPQVFHVKQPASHELPRVV